MESGFAQILIIITAFAVLLICIPVIRERRKRKSDREASKTPGADRTDRTDRPERSEDRPGSGGGIRINFSLGASGTSGGSAADEKNEFINGVVLYRCEESKDGIFCPYCAVLNSRGVRTCSCCGEELYS